VVKAIVELHGGQVTVESALEQGTTFSIFLPVPVARPA
jgi:signal transduction histidine kinase